MTLPDSPRPSAEASDQHEHERALALRVRAGDEAAYTALFRAYYPGLCTYVHAYVQSAALAEELVMDVFRKRWEGRGRWILRGTVRAYLFSAAHHAAIGYLRHRRHEDRLAEASGGQDVPALGRGPAGPAESVERLELAAAVERAVADLPARCRAVFLLWWKHELKYAQIADTLDIWVKTVEAHLTRAAKTLRARLAIFRP